MDNGQNLFVYGTLRSFHGANFLLADNEGVLLEVITVEGYKKLELGGFPGAVSAEGEGITGELWLVPKSTLELVDRYEGCPHLFKRVKVYSKDLKEYVWMYEYVGGIK